MRVCVNIVVLRDSRVKWRLNKAIHSIILTVHIHSHARTYVYSIVQEAVWINLLGAGRIYRSRRAGIHIVESSESKCQLLILLVLNCLNNSKIMKYSLLPWLWMNSKNCVSSNMFFFSNLSALWRRKSVLQINVYKNRLDQLHCFSSYLAIFRLH